MRIDKKLIQERFEASLESYDKLAEVQRSVCADLIRHLEELPAKRMERIFEIGTGTGLLTKSLAELYPDSTFFLNDLSPLTQKQTAKYCPKATYYWGDAEQIEFPKQMDLIVSTSTIQWFEDVESFLQKTAQSTTSEGVLALSTFGEENLREVRKTTGVGLEYISIESLKRAVESAGYQIITTQESLETLHFSSPIDVLHHMKLTGVNSLSKQHWQVRQLSQFNRDYSRYFSSKEGVTLTYHPIIIIAERTL